MNPSFMLFIIVLMVLTKLSQNKQYCTWFHFLYYMWCIQYHGPCNVIPLIHRGIQYQNDHDLDVNRRYILGTFKIAIC